MDPWTDDLLPPEYELGGSNGSTGDHLLGVFICGVSVGSFAGSWVSILTCAGMRLTGALWPHALVSAGVAGLIAFIIFTIMGAIQADLKWNDPAAEAELERLVAISMVNPAYWASAAFVACCILLQEEHERMMAPEPT